MNTRTLLGCPVLCAWLLWRESPEASSHLPKTGHFTQVFGTKA
jgi:hypothetical protein